MFLCFLQACFDILLCLKCCTEVTTNVQSRLAMQPHAGPFQGKRPSKTSATAFLEVSQQCKDLGQHRQRTKHKRSSLMIQRNKTADKWLLHNHEHTAASNVWRMLYVHDARATICRLSCCFVMLATTKDIRMRTHDLLACICCLEQDMHDVLIRTCMSCP